MGRSKLSISHLNNKDGLVKRVVFTILVIFILYGCNQAQKPRESLVVGLEDVSDINNTIFLTQGATNNELLAGEPFNLALVNDSTVSVVFLPDYNMRLFVLDNDAMVEVENKFQYPQNSEITLPPFSEGGLENIGVFPNFPNTDEDIITLRVVISGYIENNKSRRVGAYIDLPIYP